LPERKVPKHEKAREGPLRLGKKP